MNCVYIRFYKFSLDIFLAHKKLSLLPNKVWYIRLLIWYTWKKDWKRTWTWKVIFLKCAILHRLQKITNCFFKLTLYTTWPVRWLIRIWNVCTSIRPKINKSINNKMISQCYVRPFQPMVRRITQS